MCSLSHSSMPFTDYFCIKRGSLLKFTFRWEPDPPWQGLVAGAGIALGTSESEAQSEQSKAKQWLKFKHWEVKRIKKEITVGAQNTEQSNSKPISNQRFLCLDLGWFGIRMSRTSGPFKIQMCLVLYLLDIKIIVVVWLFRLSLAPTKLARYKFPIICKTHPFTYILFQY